MKKIACIIIAVLTSICINITFFSSAEAQLNKEIPAPAEERKTIIGDSFQESIQTNEISVQKRDVDFEAGVVLVGFKKITEERSIKNLFSEIVVEEIIDQGKCLYEAVKEGRPNDKRKHEDLKGKIGKDFIIKISDKTKTGVLNAIEILKKDTNVLYAIPNYSIEPCVTPNDYQNNNLWGLERIQAPQAWNYCTGVTSVTVGIIDTGIDNNHPDLINNVNMSLAYDAQNQNSIDTFDYNGHGTHVAGTIGATGNNAIGVTGVNWTVKLVPIKIVINNSGTGTAYVTAMVEAVRYAIRKNIPICNMSFSTPDYSCFDNAIEEYEGLFVMAAGNYGENIDNSDACTRLNSYGNVIFVSSSNNLSGENEALSSFSNYGFYNSTIAAPGENIISTIPLTGPGRGDESGYGSKSGTSMAAPHVTGVAALIKARFSDYSTSQIKEAILSGVDFSPKISGLVSTGRLNAFRALTGASDPSCLIVEPNDGETMKAAITRCLGSKNANLITYLKVVGDATMFSSIADNISASDVLPNLIYVELSGFSGNLSTNAFKNCNKLRTVILPEKDVLLPAYCFIYCPKLSTIYSTNKTDRVKGEADLTSLMVESATSSPFAAQTQCFQGCTDLTTIRLPNTAKLKFSQYVFYGCSNLTTVYIDTQTKVIGEADLTELSLIPNAIFNGTGICSVKLPKNLNISNYAFENCSELLSIQIHPSQTMAVSIGERAFYGTDYDCLVYTNQILHANNSFLFRKTDTSYIPKVVNSLYITPSANEVMSTSITRFLGNYSTSSIQHLVLVGSASMANASSTTSASILPNLETVDLSAFTGTLGTRSFYNCQKLTTVTRNANLTQIPAQCFMYCSKLNTIDVEGKYPKIYGELDLSNLSGALATNTQSFEACSSITTIRLPSAQIGIPGSFYGCTKLSTMYIDGNQKETGVFDLSSVSTFWYDFGYNFAYTNIYTVKLPINVDIGEKAFYSCSNLRRIEFEPSQTTVILLGSQAFYNVNQSCEAYMSSVLVNNTTFVIPRSDTQNVTKKAYS